MANAVRGVSSEARRQPADEASATRPGDLSSDRLELGVVERRLSSNGPRTRQATILRGLGVMFVVGALSLTAAAHAFVASDQQRIDNLQAQLTETLAEQQGLQLSRAELESPTRLLKIAEHQLGMVSPSSVSYLAPVNPGPSVEQAATDAARAAAVASKTPASRSAVQGVRTAKPVTRGSRSPASGPRSR